MICDGYGGSIWYLRGGWNAGMLLCIYLGICMSRDGIFFLGN